MSSYPSKTCQVCSLVTCCAASVTETSSCEGSTPIVQTSKILKKGERLHKEKEKFNSIYAIQSGSLKAYQFDIHGKEHIHHFYFPGEVIGFEAISPGQYPYTIIALTETKLCEIPYKKLLQLMKQAPRLQHDLLTAISQRFSYKSRFTSPDADQRVCSFLLDIFDRLNSKNNLNEMKLYMSRYDIGNFLGLAPETVSRVLTRFDKLKLLSVNNRSIKLLDRKKLETQWGQI